MRSSGAVCALAVAASAAVLGGCDSLKDSKTVLFGTGSGLTARLHPANGSAAYGVVSFAQYRDNVAVDLSVSGLRLGQYRVVIHTTGLCNSPNGFAAGPPYSPPGVVPPLETQLKPFYVSNDYPTEVTARVVGISLDGPNSILGRSVIVHEGAEGSLDAVPGVPNGRVACGIIGPVGALF